MFLPNFVMKFQRNLGFYNFRSGNVRTVLPRVVIFAFLLLAATQILTLFAMQPTWTNNIAVSFPKIPNMLSSQAKFAHPTNFEGTLK